MLPAAGGRLRLASWKLYPKLSKLAASFTVTVLDETITNSNRRVLTRTHGGVARGQRVSAAPMPS